MGGGGGGAEHTSVIIRYHYVRFRNSKEELFLFYLPYNKA